MAIEGRGTVMTEQVQMETQEDLFAFLRQLPDAERFAALGVLSRLQKGKITAYAATAEIKGLFFRCGLAVEDNAEGGQS